MDTPITRAEHEEFARRIEEGERRQDKRLELLESATREISAMTASIQQLAANIAAMQKELAKQSQKLETIESRDGEKWRSVTGYIATSIIGLVIGYVFSQLG